MVDNFKQIKSLLEFPNDDIYYHLQILRRGKDHPELPAANRVIKPYFICSLESLDYIEEEVKELCKFFKARAYINLTPKSIKKTTMLQIKYIAQRAYEGDFKKIWKSWNTCAGEIKGEESRWVVDIDIPCYHEEQSEEFFNEMDEYLKHIPPYSFDLKNNIYRSKIIAKIPTKSGYHLITSPFDVKLFQEKYPHIDIHKNNPTLLYYED